MRRWWPAPRFDPYPYTAERYTYPYPSGAVLDILYRCQVISAAEWKVWHAHVGAGLLPPGAPVSLAVHPLQLYFAVPSLALGLFTARIARRQHNAGQVFLAYVTLYGCGQFLLEFLRAARSFEASHSPRGVS